MRFWIRLFDGDGATLAEWIEPVGGTARTIVLDSAQIRARFGLGAFAGQLFIHAIGATGHDVVKYALDTYGPDQISCTHDANAWPSDWYAGLPAPKADERVVLWIQNSHPCAIPPGEVGINVMGDDRGERGAATLGTGIGPFATLAVDVGALMPDASWPQQLEVSAGKHFVRPRYEIATMRDGARSDLRIAHMNVERSDLVPDMPLLRVFASVTPLPRLRLAVDYSARDLLAHAVCEAAKTGGASKEDIAALLGRAMHDTGPSPDVDLLIRTGGEQRLSDFLLWECAYAELLFTPRMWPDFDAEDLASAIEDYHGRDRRFGRVAVAV